MMDDGWITELAEGRTETEGRKWRSKNLRCANEHISRKVQMVDLQEHPLSKIVACVNTVIAHDVHHAAALTPAEHQQ